MLRVSYTYHSEIGSRPYQEDRGLVISKNRGKLLAVIDGHGGDSTAQCVSDNLKAIFSGTITKMSEEDALFSTFAKLHLLTRENVSGAVVSMVWIPFNASMAYVAVLGDAPVFITNPGEETWAGPNHNVRTNLKERRAAEKAGAIFNDGYIWNSSFTKGLQMSRALGDVALDYILNRQPEVNKVPIYSGAIIVVATDGVLDPTHQDVSQEKHIIQMAENGAEAKDLVLDAVKRDTRDNVTAIIARIL